MKVGFLKDSLKTWVCRKFGFCFVVCFFFFLIELTVDFVI